MKSATCDIFYIFSCFFLYFLLLFDTFWGRAQAATHNYAKLKGMLKCPVLRGDPENRKFISKQRGRDTLSHTNTRMLCTSTCELCDSNKKQLKVPRLRLRLRLLSPRERHSRSQNSHSHSLSHSYSLSRTHIYIHVYCVATTPTSTRLIHILFRHCCCRWRRLLA